MVKGIPENWHVDEIKKRFGTISGLTDVFVIKNSIGKNSGKVLVTYSTQDEAEQCILHFNNRAVANLVC